MTFTRCRWVAPPRPLLGLSYTLHAHSVPRSEEQVAPIVRPTDFRPLKSWNSVNFLGIGAVPVFGGALPGGRRRSGHHAGDYASFQAAASRPRRGHNFNWSNLKSLASWKNLYFGMTLAGDMLMMCDMQRGSALSTIGGGAVMSAGIGLSGGPIGAIGDAGALPNASASGLVEVDEQGTTGGTFSSSEKIERLKLTAARRSSGSSGSGAARR